MTFEDYERDMNDQGKMEKLRMETAAAMKHSAEWVVFSIHAVVDSLKARCSYNNLPNTILKPTTRSATLPCSPPTETRRRPRA